MLVNLILALAPTVVIIAFVKSRDMYEKEPNSLLVKLFVFGCLSVIPAVILESIISLPMTGVISALVACMVNIALVEEGVKYAAVKMISYRSRSFDEIYDGILYSVMVSLGFASVENVLYVLSYGTQTALVRAVTAVPAHAIFAVSMGYYLALRKANINPSLNRVLALLVPVLLHGVYDFILFTGSELTLLIFVPYVIWLYVRAGRLISSTSRMEPFDESDL